MNYERLQDNPYNFKTKNGFSIDALDFIYNADATAYPDYPEFTRDRALFAMNCENLSKRRSIWHQQ